jgi:MoaA/NifB/PqqE/SkfB family radical SAM enzyme
MLMFSTAQNLFKLAGDDHRLQPRVALYHVTGQCNLNCAYCEDFGARRNAASARPLPLEQVLRILSVIRSGVDALFLTGGEPLTHPDIDQIVLQARQALKFRQITLISNGLLLAQHEALLPALDRLVISLDSCDPGQWSQTIGAPSATAQAILANVRHYAARQKEFGYRMIVNAVLTPETLPGADALLDFCTAQGSAGGGTLPLLVSFSPQAVNNWPRYELTVSPEYRAFIEKLLRLKRSGAPILGSQAYLRTLRDMTPYDCYPTLAPRIYSNGDLAYPCRPFEKADNGQGGRPANLLEVSSWAEAWEKADKAYGPPPRACHSCFQQCYAEASLMAAQPLALLGEWLRYPASRAGDLTTYTPG